MKPTIQGKSESAAAVRSSVLFGVWHDPLVTEPYDYDPLIVWARKHGELEHSWWQAFWDGLDYFEFETTTPLVDVTHWMPAPPSPNEKADA